MAPKSLELEELSFLYDVGKFKTSTNNPEQGSSALISI